MERCSFKKKSTRVASIRSACPSIFFRRIALKQHTSSLQRLGKGMSFRASLRVGIFGGSFDPAHEGHVAVARTAKTKLRLGRVLWVVAKGTPLKNPLFMKPFVVRFAKTRKLVATLPKGLNDVSDLEQKFSLAYTHELVEALSQSFPKLNLVFLVGADGFANFMCWHSWRKIAHLLPLAVFTRDNHSLPAKLSNVARTLPSTSANIHSLHSLVTTTAPRWAFVPMQPVSTSSSSIRKGSNER